MRWQDIDEKRKLWIVPSENTKNRRKHEVPLSDFTLKILTDIEKHEDGIYIFSANGKYPFSNFGKGKILLDRLIGKKRQEALINSEINEWRLHDLRRTAASGMAGLGVAPHIVERILNHSSGVISGVAAIYNRYDYQDEMKAALNKWANRVEEIVNLIPKSEKAA